MPSAELLREKCLVVIPALNEADTISSVVSNVKAQGYRHIMVIDDFSTDDTGRLAEEAGALVISLSQRLGAWGATQTGMRYAVRKGFSTVITMDADDQHPVEYLDTLLMGITESANVAIGSFPERGSGLRQIAWRWIRGASGVKLDDLTSGFRAYDRLAVRRLASWQATLFEYQDIGVLLLLQRHGLVVRDIPVTMRERRAGKSRIFHSWAMVAYYMSHTLLLSASKRVSVRSKRSSTVRKVSI